MNQKKMKKSYNLISLAALVVIAVLSVTGVFWMITDKGSSEQTASVEEQKEGSQETAEGSGTEDSQQAATPEGTDESSVVENIAEESTLSANEDSQDESQEEPQNEEKKFEEPEEPKGTIYLTFDDGPSMNNTPAILDILAENEIQATFFILNYEEEEKPILERMIKEGHTIGIHGYSHDYAAIYQSDEAFMDNVYRLRDRLKEDFGYEAFVMRFPGGSSNETSRQYSVGIMSRLADRVESEGWLYDDWNVDSGDGAGDHVPADKLLENYKTQFRHDKDCVVLMHDAPDKDTTVQALQGMIDYGREQEYVFRPTTKDSYVDHHIILN